MARTTTRASTKAYAKVHKRGSDASVKGLTSKITKFTENHHWNGID